MASASASSGVVGGHGLEPHTTNAVGDSSRRDMDEGISRGGGAKLSVFEPAADRQLRDRFDDFDEVAQSAAVLRHQSLFLPLGSEAGEDVRRELANACPKLGNAIWVERGSPGCGDQVTSSSSTRTLSRLVSGPLRDRSSFEDERPEVPGDPRRSRVPERSA